MTKTKLGIIQYNGHQAIILKNQKILKDNKEYNNVVDFINHHKPLKEEIVRKRTTVNKFNRDEFMKAYIKNTEEEKYVHNEVIYEQYMLDLLKETNFEIPEYDVYNFLNIHSQLDEIDEDTLKLE